MATLENGENNAKSSRRGISFQFQSKDLPSRRLLGKGLSGIGYETTWKGASYARKDFVGVQRDIFLQEATVLVGLKDHKNIVKTYGWTIDKRSCSLVLEYVDEDLLSLLQKRMDSKRSVVGKQSSSSTSTHPVDLPEALDMMLQIATGVEYLHEQGLAHGDLKTKNILVTHKKDGDQSSKVLKLSDFGLVRAKRRSRYIVSRKVRKLDMVRWKSPESLEILSRRLHSSNSDEDETSSESESESTPSSVPEVSSVCAGTKSSDVYSFALICWQILTGHSPYPYLDWKELMVKILSGCRPDLPDSCHPLLRELLISCWGDAAERPSFFAVRMKLKRVQGLLTTAMGKRPQEEAAPLVADSPAHKAAVVPSTEVSRSTDNCLSLKPSNGPAIVPSERTASVATIRNNTPGVPSAASSVPSPATAAASPAADESYEPPQTEDLVKGLEEPLLRDIMAASDASMKDRSFDLSVSTSSDLHNDSTIGRYFSDLAGTSFLKKFVENEGGTSRICETSATEAQTGTMDTGNAVVPSSAPFKPFQIWRKTPVLSPQRKREKNKNQWLLRSCFEILTLQRDLQQGIQTHGDVSQSTVSQGPPLCSSCKSDILGEIDLETFLQDKVNPQWLQSTPCRGSMPHLGADGAAGVHMLAERTRRKRQKENFEALRRLVPAKSKNDKASILGDAITYLKDLQREIHDLEASKNQVERQYEDLKSSHQDLEQRNQQLEVSKRQVERQYEDLKSSHQDLEQRNQQLDSQVDDEYQHFLSSHQEHRKKPPPILTTWEPLHQNRTPPFRLEARKKKVKDEFEGQGGLTLSGMTEDDGGMTEEYFV